MGILNAILVGAAGATALFAVLFVLSRWWAHRFPRIFQVLWLVFFVKLLVPVGVWSPLPSVVDLPAGSSVPATSATVGGTKDGLTLEAGPGSRSVDLAPALGAVWMLGTLVVWGASLGGPGWRREGGPAAVGIFRPRVILPPGFTEVFTALEQDLIVAHEGTHLRTRDPLWLALV